MDFSRIRLSLLVIGVLQRPSTDWLQVENLFALRARCSHKRRGEDRLPDICIGTKDLVDPEVME